MFFFSSRRRHTRFKCDWSSDVCSSDLAILTASAAFGQLTTDQKLTDFQSMAAIYAKRYAPYEWKKQLFGFDLLKIKPFLDRAAATKNDLDYYDICAEYVQSLHDGHDFFQL